MWFFAGNDVTINFDFIVDGEFVVPASPSYTVRNHLGVNIIGPQALTGVQTSTSLMVPAASNQLGEGALYENRFVLVNFLHNGKIHTLVQPYKIAPFIPMTAQPEDVRRLVGLAEAELPDRDIDVLSAYFKLYDAYGADFFNQLTATTFKNRLANEAIALQAAIDVVVSFPLRVPVSIRNEDSQFSRTTTIDWGAMEMSLRRQLQQNLTAVISVEETTVTVFSVTSPTDPVTGA